jgi:diadenosine tetraphosphate (Ap4A) HIT family hydrolase
MRERAISTQAIDQIGQVRFRELLCGHNRERAAYDQVLLETHECVVAPTLGSIVPNWLLVVPRRPVVSFRKWQAITRMDPIWLVGEIVAELEIEAEQAIWFEHGPSAEGSPIGCGVDHAHLHVLVDAPFSFEQFAATAVENARVDWRRSSSREAYDTISAGCSYLVGGSLNEAVLAEDVESVGSQFFRRVVAQLAGKPHQWNYKTHAHLENVRRTVSAFNSRRALAAAL